MDAELVRRVGFAAVAIPLALLIVWYGGLPLAAPARRRLRARDARAVRPGRAAGVRPARALGAASAARDRAARIPGAHAPALRRRGRGSALALRVALWLIAVLTWAARARARRRPPAGGGRRHAARRRVYGALPAFLLAIRHGQLRSGAGPAPGWCSFRWW